MANSSPTPPCPGNVTFTHVAGIASGYLVMTKDDKRVLPTFKLGGNDFFAQKHVRDKRLFWRDITELFAISGLGGQFQMVVKGKLPGRHHTKGLTLGIPAAGGAIFSIHYGSNDDRFESMIVAPHGMDSNHFTGLLKTGKGLLDRETADQALERRARYGQAGQDLFAPEAKKFAEKKPVAAAPPQAKAAPAPVPTPPPAQPPAPAAPTPTTPPKVATPRSKALSSDSTSMTLYMEELGKHATPDGYVSRADCLRVLVDQSFVQGQGAGSVLASLIRDEHLVTSSQSENWLSFGSKWQKLANTPSLPAAGLSDIQQLTVLLTEERGLRAQREAVATDIGRVESEVARLERLLQTQREVLFTSQAGLQEIDAKLADPKYASAREHVELIRKILSEGSTS
ncbi:MAG: hypothetical protein WCK46_00500 [Candidatus Adlerbacteria bacterium]